MQGRVGRGWGGLGEGGKTQLLRDRAGGGGGGGWHFCMEGGVRLGGRRPDPGLLVPNASRQEAEANSGLSCIK